MFNNEKLGRKSGTKPHIHLLPMAALVLFGLIALAGVAAADNVYKATPPVEVLFGTLNDNISVDCVDAWNASANRTAGNEQKVWANFTLNDAPSDVDLEFARLYVVVYSGNMSANYTGHVSVGLYNDTNYLAQLAAYQPLDLPYNLSAGNEYNESVVSPLVSLTRVTSDYLLIFNITDTIQEMGTTKLNLNISTWNTTGNFDGRVKNVQLITGYSDSGKEGDTIHYWINEGFDTVTKYSSPVPYYGETYFNISGVEDPSKVKLWVGLQNNVTKNAGAYKWNNVTINNTEIMCSGTYGGLIYANLTPSYYSLQNNNLLEYNNGTNSWYKIHTAILAIEEG